MSDLYTSTGSGIYIHWPFCAAKCPYCDFNSHVSKQAVDQDSFVDAFITELSHRVDQYNFSSPKSIFIGGGTPSLMEPKTVEKLLNAIDARLGIPSNIEITLEANPSSVESARFKGYRQAGVNRVSIGVQSLIDSELKFLGRLHTSSQALEAIELADTIFPRFSFDLIYARPNQTAKSWGSELSQALSLGSNHLSLYQLTIEPNTPFYNLHQSGKLVVPDSDNAAELYTLTKALTSSSGLQNYEISNYAVAGEESQHNLIYWRSGTWLGLGPGAHSRLVKSDGARHALINISSPQSWLSQVESQGHGTESEECLTPHSISQEFLLMGLRLQEGIDLCRLRPLVA